MPFYTQNPDRFLRFGDVLRGYITADVSIKEPLLRMSFESTPYKIEISTHHYYVVLTPCCSIEDASITISPLVPIKSTFLKNPFFVEDPKRINLPLLPEQTMAPTDWEKLDPSRKTILENEGKNYTLLQYFVYESSDHFKPYTLKGNTINNYMVDFKDIHEIKCELIKHPLKIKETDNYQPITDSKILQLTPDSRSDLRNKLLHYYSRKAEEDLVASAI